MHIPPWYWFRHLDGRRLEGRPALNYAGGAKANLAGMEPALHLTRAPLGVWKGLSAGRGPVQVATSMKRIDGMLATLGMWVVPTLKREEQQSLPEPGEGWFKVNPGAALELDSGQGRAPLRLRLAVARRGRGKGDLNVDYRCNSEFWKRITY